MTVVRGIPRSDNMFLVEVEVKVLPALGWKRQSGDRYRRDGEVLSLAFGARPPGVEIRIRVVPAGTEKAR